MPHSSGGGSHGGGFHGGGSRGGSSGRTYSTHYFPGARRFRYRDEKGNDRYVYSTVKPQKPSMFGVIAPLVFGGFMGLMILPTLFASAPKKLSEDYPEPDAYVYDNIGVIADEDALTDELEEFRDITGICPVIYTVDDDDWQYDFSRLESYAMDLYTDNYDDEQHFVIVYSIDSEHIEDNDFAWEAIQGDETDPIITESFFEDFGESLQEEFEDEQEVGEAFTKAFRAATKRAEDRINPSSSRRIAAMLAGSFPIIAVVGAMAAISAASYKNYKKMKDVEYEEVPLESQPDSLAKGVSPAKAAQTGATMSNASSSVRIAVGVIGLLILIPFLIVGFFLTIGAIIDVTQGEYAALMIALVWDVIVIFAMIGTIKGLFSNNKKKKQAAPLTAEYPKPDKNFAKPVSAADKDKPEDRNIFGTNTSPELGDTGLFNRKHKTDYDDEDYQRMKRQGYE